MRHHRAGVVAIAFFGVQFVVATCYGQGWTIETPPSGGEFLRDDLISGSGMAPSGNIGATFHFMQFIPGSGYHTWGSEDFTSESFTTGGVTFHVWTKALDPAEERSNGLWPPSDLDDTTYFPIPDYAAVIYQGSNYLDATFTHKVTEN